MPREQMRIKKEQIIFAKTILKRMMLCYNETRGDMMECPKCKGVQFVKAGFNHGRQRYQCKECGRQITRTEDKNATKRIFALYFYMAGLSMNSIAKMLEIAPSTVLYWVRNFALKVYEKAESPDAVAVNLDEMRSFLDSKQLKFGPDRCMAALPVKSFEERENQRK